MRVFVCLLWIFATVICGQQQFLGYHRRTTTQPFYVGVTDPGYQHKEDRYRRLHVEPYLQHGYTMYGMSVFGVPNSGAFTLEDGVLTYHHFGFSMYASIGTYDIIEGIRVLNINGIEDNPLGIQAPFMIDAKDNLVVQNQTIDWISCVNLTVPLKYPYAVIAAIHKNETLPRGCRKVQLAACYQDDA